MYGCRGNSVGGTQVWEVNIGVGAYVGVSGSGGGCFGCRVGM